jgi:hypothetical protein
MKLSTWREIASSIFAELCCFNRPCTLKHLFSTTRPSYLDRFHIHPTDIFNGIFRQLL